MERYSWRTEQTCLSVCIAFFFLQCRAVSLLQKPRRMPAENAGGLFDTISGDKTPGASSVLLLLTVGIVAFPALPRCSCLLFKTYAGAAYAVKTDAILFCVLCSERLLLAGGPVFGTSVAVRTVTASDLTDLEHIAVRRVHIILPALTDCNDLYSCDDVDCQTLPCRYLFHVNRQTGYDVAVLTIVAGPVTVPKPAGYSAVVSGCLPDGSLYCCVNHDQLLRRRYRMIDLVLFGPAFLILGLLRWSLMHTLFTPSDPFCYCLYCEQYCVVFGRTWLLFYYTGHFIAVTCHAITPSITPHYLWIAVACILPLPFVLHCSDCSSVLLKYIFIYCMQPCNIV